MLRTGQVKMSHLSKTNLGETKINRTKLITHDNLPFKIKTDFLGFICKMEAI